MWHYELASDKKLEFKALVTRIFSENCYLAAGRKKKKIGNKQCFVFYLYKRQDVRQYQSKLEKALHRDYKQLLIDNAAFFASNKFRSTFKYQLRESIDRRDLSNMKKLLEDSLTNVIKKVLTGIKAKEAFDDSMIYETHEIKIELIEGDKEVIEICLEALK
jgi:hypothetical protein